MEHAPLGVPSYTGRGVRGNTFARQTAFALVFGRLNRRSPVVLWFKGFLLAWMVCAMAFTGRAASKPYLPCIGPTMLRFAPTPNKTNSFRWPGSALAMKAASPEGRATTNVPNSEILGPPAPEVGSIAPDNGSQTVAAPSALETILTTEMDPNPSSASGLLLVTPQMLAEYFKPGLEGTNGPAQQAPLSQRVQFIPPTGGTVPSSEAVYRVK